MSVTRFFQLLLVSGNAGGSLGLAGFEGGGDLSDKLIDAGVEPGLGCSVGFVSLVKTSKEALIIFITDSASSGKKIFLHLGNVVSLSDAKVTAVTTKQ